MFSPRGAVCKQIPTEKCGIRKWSTNQNIACFQFLVFNIFIYFWFLQSKVMSAELLTEEERSIPVTKYEYLDHTADVQLHAWGDTLTEAFEQCAESMFGYMTEIDKVEILDVCEIEAKGEDVQSLLYHFLDEFLFIFSAEPFFIARKVKITEFDKSNFSIKAKGYGETFDLSKHPQGTEVKAITYSNMQIHESEKMCEVYVIIDI